MRMTKPNALALAMLVVWLAPLGASRAAADRKESPCAESAPRVGDLGILSLDCDCGYDLRSRSKDGRVRIVRRWTFRSEPRVAGIRADGPAAGRLREGDILAAIDGVLITTREGARRFAEVAPGARATLTVRREGREIPVRIVADAVCPELATWPESVQFEWAERGVLQPEPAAPAAPPRPRVVVIAPGRPEPAPNASTPAPASSPDPTSPLLALAQPPDAVTDSERSHAPRPRRLALLPKPAIPTEDALPRGWSGFGLTCRNCGGMPGDSGGPSVWEFGTHPSIYFIDPGSPAALAGIQIGDVLTHLDGISLLTEEGGRRFGGLKPGQSVRWKIRRGGRVRTATVVTELRPDERTLPLAELSEKLRALGEGGEVERLSADLARAVAELNRRGLLTQARSTSGNHLRFAGAVGGSEVEVRGLGNVVVDDSGEEIVITTRDATIRIRPTAAPAASRPPHQRERK